MLEVKYVKMPISIEEKKEYNRQGFRVVDERFAPADYQEDDGEVSEKVKLTVAELRAALDDAGIEYAADAKKAALVELYNTIPKGE